MRCAFVVIASRVDGPRGRRPRDAASPVLSVPEPSGLPFPVTGIQHWSDAAGALHLAAWRDATAGAGATPWAVHDGSIAVVHGAVRRRGQPWGDPATWPTVLAHAVEPGAGASLDELTGIFAGVHLDAHRGGVAVCDPLGLRGLYVAHRGDVTAVASHPRLAALAVATGGEPARDAVVATSLAFTRHKALPGTGYADVQVLDAGEWVELRPDGRAPVRRRPDLLVPAPELRHAPLVHVVDRAEAVLDDQVRAALSYPADGHDVDLTGGKDSRLVLATILSAGLTDGATFRTDGGPRIPDVAVACELASQFGLHHEVAMRRPPERYAPPADADAPWRERAASFVRATAGGTNLWWQKPGSGPTVPVRIGGLLGESLRGLGSILPDRDTALALVHRRYGRLGLLRPDAERSIRERITARVLDGAPASFGPNDLEHRYRLRVHIRQNCGLREDLDASPRLLPLYDVAAIRAAFALGAEARGAEQIHRQLVRRASPDLEAHRFSSRPWQEPRPVPPLAGRRPDERSATTAAAPSDLDRRRQMNHAGAHEAAAGEILTLLDEALADRTNPAWEHLDPMRVRAAMDRHDELGTHERVELVGAATAALWLGGDELGAEG